MHADLLDAALAEGRGVIISHRSLRRGGVPPGSLAFRGYPITMVVKYQTRQLKMTMEGIARRGGRRGPLTRKKVP